MNFRNPNTRTLSALHCIFWTLLSGSIHGQKFYNVGQNIWVGEEINLVLPDDLVNNGVLKNGGTLDVEGSILNSSILTNNGTISLSGNWNNQQVYNEGTGNVFLVGGSQSLNHNDQSFYSLWISGGGVKTFESDVTVSDELLLEGGIIQFDEAHKLLITSEARISGGSPTAYVSGPLFHQGVGYKFFPIGKNGNYRPAALEDVGGIDPVIGMEMFEPNPETNQDFDLERISETRFWKMEIEGSFDGSIISLALSDDGLGDEIDKTVIAEAKEEGGVFRNLGRSENGSPNPTDLITSELPATGGIYALGLASERQPEDVLFVPNSVYPSSPHPEDRVAKVYGVRVSTENFLFKIYNRWGNTIYETVSFEEASLEGWDGINHNSGKEQSPGTFKYVLKGMFEDGTPFVKVGSIALMR